MSAGDRSISDVSVFTNGHRVVHFNDRWLCTRCDAVQLTLFQFSSVECPKRLFRPGILP